MFLQPLCYENQNLFKTSPKEATTNSWRRAGQYALSPL